MSPSSYELPRKPVPVEHIDCGSVFDMYAIDWPPMVVICPKCRIVLGLVGHDKETKRLSYRRI